MYKRQHLRVIADETLWNFNDYMRYFHGFPYQRVGIDIFPMDYISRDIGITNVQKQIIRLGIETLRDWNKLEENGMLDEYVNGFQKLCNVSFGNVNNVKNYMWKIIDKISSISYREEADYITNIFYWLDNDNYKMKKECYDYTIELPFENMNIVAPEMYDEVLRAEYGDYMVPVKGAADHDYPFYGHMESELIKQIRNVGFKGSVDEFCEEVASGRLRV